MGVSLLEVVENGGYDLNTVDDAIWLLSKQREFESLIEKAQEIVDTQHNLENEAFESEYKERL